MNSTLEKVYFNNTIFDYLVALGIILLGTLILRLFKKLILIRLKKISSKSAGTVDDVVVDSIERFGVAALQFAVIYWGINYLTLSTKAANVVHVATSIIVTYFILRLISTVILIVLTNRIRSQEEGENKIKQLGGLMLLINIVIWATGIVFLLDNLNYNVTTIITGLGIGGIAIALAAQNILGDLFNYFVIFFDRPFEAGDFIVVDDKMGTVEYVGIKTTRIRALSGEQIIIGNSNLTGSRIHNFKRLFNRRVAFNLNLDLKTPLEKVRTVPLLIRPIIENKPLVKVDRIHFASIADWNLKFEVVYFFLDPDFNKFMDVQQNINLEILQVLSNKQIYLAATPHVSLAPPPPPLPSEQKKPEEE